MIHLRLTPKRGNAYRLIKPVSDIDDRCGFHVQHRRGREL